MTSYLAS